MRWIVVLLAVCSCFVQSPCVDGQEPVPILTLRFASAERSKPRLVELASRLASESGDGVVLTCDPSTKAYAVSQSEEELPDGNLGELVLSANEWRFADPDAFEPGSMNGLLGAVGVADARTIRVVVDEPGDRFVIRWDRREEDPDANLVHEQLIASRIEGDDPSFERWAIEEIGIGRFIAGACRVGVAIEDGQRTPSDIAFGTSWLSGRNALLHSLDRSTAGAEIVITDNLRSAVVFRFDPAIKATSLRRASLRVVPEGIPEVEIHGKVAQPKFAVAQGKSGAVVVLAPTQGDLDDVLESMGLQPLSGGDGP